MAYLFARLSEASTWRGLFALLTAFGVAIAPDLMEAIITFGLSAIGVIGVVFADKVNPE